ncbi:ammonium transporter [Gordonia sp. VNK21]|uniref:ammonium transporter n=1 Tax=Gordonia sp. VNK21 TaxID=3382483 RepID=UPI0038D3918F
MDGGVQSLLAEQVSVSAGDTSWVLICAALVLFMTPGLAVFYAGMVDRRSVLVMLQQNILPIAVISLTWIIVGYSLAFGKDNASFIGNFELFGLGDLGQAPDNPRHIVDAASHLAIPTLAFVAYQMMFAIITPALISGAVVNRLKAFGWIVLLAAWSIVVYPPIAHWLWSTDGWATKMGAQDWAGGMVVHTSAGAAVLALLVVLGRRRVYPDRAPLPHSVPLVILGAGILWFGWFGFNAGDGLRADGLAAQAMLNTQVAGAAAMAVWLLIEWLTTRTMTVLGAVTGGVAGLATITPAAGYVGTAAAVAIGLIAGLVCHLALHLKNVFKYDDALDVVAVHFIGGILGSLLVGFFGDAAVNPTGKDGIFAGGGGALLGHQVVALLAVIGYAFGLMLVLAYLIEWTIGLRVRPEDEDRIDQVQQDSSAYVVAPPIAAPGDGAQHPARADGRRAGVVLTAILDRAELDDQLRQQLISAGAETILVSSAHNYTAGPVTATVRGQTRTVPVPAQIRAEVVAPEGREETISAVLHASPSVACTFSQGARCDS